MARTAERGKLDAVLLGLPAADANAGNGINTMRLDPLPLLGTLIAATERIGLGAAWTIDFTEPYNVARVFATLDHLSYGRSAWIAQMFETDALISLIGKPNPATDIDMYRRRADEFIDSSSNCGTAGKMRASRSTRRAAMFVDPQRVHPIEHEGAFFKVRGPLNVPRPPQGNPVIIMSDPADPVARQFVAATTDVILTDCPGLSDACTRYRNLYALAVGSGRSDDTLRVLANVNVVLGETEALARRRAGDLDARQPWSASPSRFVGTPEQFAARLDIWQQEGACDGFNILPAVLPDDLDLLVDAVIPLLQRDGLFRGRRRAALLRPAAALVPRPPGAGEPGLQRTLRLRPRRAARAGGARRRPRRDRAPPRGAAHPLRRARRRAAAGDRGRSGAGAPAAGRPLSALARRGAGAPSWRACAPRRPNGRSTSPRDPSCAPALVRLGAEEHALLLDFHHVVYDGWSEGVLLRELAALYAAAPAGAPSPLPRAGPPVCRLRGLAAGLAAGGARRAQLAYWRGQLAGAPTALELPADRPRPAVASLRGAGRRLLLGRRRRRRDSARRRGGRERRSTCCSSRPSRRRWRATAARRTSWSARRSPTAPGRSSKG